MSNFMSLFFESSINNDTACYSDSVVILSAERKNYRRVGVPFAANNPYWLDTCRGMGCGRPSKQKSRPQNPAYDKGNEID
jgi:hypothetical protein